MNMKYSSPTKRIIHTERDMECPMTCNRKGASSLVEGSNIGALTWCGNGSLMKGIETPVEQST